jgi:hypothetical protein
MVSWLQVGEAAFFSRVAGRPERDPASEIAMESRIARVAKNEFAAGAAAADIEFARLIDK